MKDEAAIRVELENLVFKLDKEKGSNKSITKLSFPERLKWMMTHEEFLWRKSLGEQLELVFNTKNEAIKIKKKIET